MGKKGECGSSKWREGRGGKGGRREQLVSFRWGTRLCETEGEGGLSPGIIRIIFKVNESHSESVWGSFDDSTHFHPSLSKICQALWLPGISDWSVLFVAADMTIILLGSSADVDNEPRQITRGMDNANFQILKRMFIDYWSRKKQRVTIEVGMWWIGLGRGICAQLVIDHLSDLSPNSFLSSQTYTWNFTYTTSSETDIPYLLFFSVLLLCLLSHTSGPLPKTDAHTD